MELVTLTTAITTLIFSEALKEGGKNLGKGVSEQIARLIAIVREKLKAVGTEGLLTRVQNQPTEFNKSIFKAELQSHIKEDETFANQLKQIMKQLELTEDIRQVMATGIEISGNLEAEDMSQKATRGSSVEQEMLKDIKAQNIKLGNLNQES